MPEGHASDGQRCYYSGGGGGGVLGLLPGFKN